MERKYDVAGKTSAPGIEHHEIKDLQGSSDKVTITSCDYGVAQVSIQQITDLDGFLAQHRPEWTAVRWINVAGLSDMSVMQSLATKYDLHPLAIEDIFQRTHRPKVESYGGGETEFMARLFIITQALYTENDELKNEQISIFLGHKTVLSFQDGYNDLWEPVLHRIKNKGSRLRSHDASFLAYSMLDVLVDRNYPILESYSDRAEALETLILDNSTPGLIKDINQLNRDLLQVRRVIWPMREVVSSLQRDPHECISEVTHVYLRDLYDHVVQIIDLIETNREIVSELTDTYMSSVSNRMNEIMKVLTLIGTIFIPLTFLAGVYGMNFTFFPELKWPWAYPIFWIVCIVAALLMIWMFRRRKWL
jgi:magnesium transporter